MNILKIDSTSGKERKLAEYIAGNFISPGAEIRTGEVGDGTLNVIISWGTPDIVFCTHLDTVPPYIGPVLESGVVRGRGSCDAKGQLFAMYSACLELEIRGYTGFGLLLLAGEETGSSGAKISSRLVSGGEYAIVGEPTSNRMISASKGTKAFEVEITGTGFHSGYPEYGSSAVERFVDFANMLRTIKFPTDPELGDTTYNIGMLASDNPQNILSDFLSFRIYFRTTFASDDFVVKKMKSFSDGKIFVRSLGGDCPSRYVTLPGFGTGTVSFGSDAPHLKYFKHKILYGPGSILVAHTGKEHISLKEIENAVNGYIRMYEILTGRGRYGE